MASSVSTSGAITFTGLGSGTDFDSIIEQLVEVETATRVTPLEEWKATWEEKITAFQELNTQMLALQTALEAIDTKGEFLIKTATSSDTTVLSATAGADAQADSHTVEVKRLAQNAIMVTDTGYSSATETINTSGAARVFAYTYAGETYSVTVPIGATLTDLKNIINTDGDNPGVKATLVNDGSSYYLQLRGMDTGDDATLAISASTTLAGFSSADFSTTQTNQDALLKVDGWPTGTTVPDNYISRDSNSIDDLIDGITLSLRTTGTVTLSTEVDTDAVKANIETFVEQVNLVRTMIKDITEVDTSLASSVSTTSDSTQTTGGSILTGNYGIQLISSRLKDVTASMGIGFDWDIDTYTSLSSIGISTDADEGSATLGLLVIDDEALDAALENDIDSVATLFSADYEGSTNSSDFSYQSHIDGITEAGTYEVSYTVSGGAITAATIDGHPVTISGNTIMGNADYPESGLLLEIKNLTNGTYTGNAYMKQGKTGEIVDVLGDLTNSTSGPLAILEENYNEIIDMIDDKIAYQEERITLMESRLREKYARLEALLGYYEDLSTSLESQIDELGE